MAPTRAPAPTDPSMDGRDYSAAEMEFMGAMHEYKQRSGRMFPTWSEVLEVLRGLGYDHVARRQGPAPTPPGGYLTPPRPWHTR